MPRRATGVDREASRLPGPEHRPDLAGAPSHARPAVRRTGPASAPVPPTEYHGCGPCGRGLDPAVGDLAGRSDRVRVSEARLMGVHQGEQVHQVESAAPVGDGQRVEPAAGGVIAVAARGRRIEQHVSDAGERGFPRPRQPVAESAIGTEPGCTPDPGEKCEVGGDRSSRRFGWGFRLATVVATRRSRCPATPPIMVVPNQDRDERPSSSTPEPTGPQGHRWSR
jgi:hypothetical protein